MDVTYVTERKLVKLRRLIGFISNLTC